MAQYNGGDIMLDSMVITIIAIGLAAKVLPVVVYLVILRWF